MRRAGGHTRFELLVAVCLIAILAGVLLERLLYYQEQAERTAMETTIMHIRSGMRWHVADLMTQQRSHEIGAMLEQNPVRWLQRPPAGYLGALTELPEGGVPGGSWYFDSLRHELVYVPQLKRFLSGGLEGREIRFQVQAKISTWKKNGDAAENAEGIDISVGQPYRWF